MIKWCFKIFVELVAIGVAGLTVLVVFAIVRLSMGPISLDILTPHIERGLNAEGGNFKVTLGGSVLAWSQADQDLDIVVKNVRVTDRQGAEQAYVTKIAIGLSIRALIGGEFRPTRLEFFRPRLRLVRGEDGRIQLGDPSAGRPAPTPATGESTAKDSQDSRDLPFGGEITATLLGSLLTRPAPDHPLRYLRSIALSDAALEFEDIRNNFRLTSPASELVLVRDKDGIAVSAHLSLTAAGKTAPVDITGSYRVATKKIQLTAHFGNLELARLAKLGAALAPLEAIRFPADGELGLTMDADGRIDTITLEATAGAGKLALKGLYAKPIEVRAMRIKARADDGLTRFTLDHLTVDLGGPRIGLAGQGVRAGGLTSVTLDVTARDVTILDLKRLWPKGVAPAAREWITENIDQGKVGRADTRVEFTLAHGRDGKPGGIDVRRLEGGFDFADLTIHYLKPLPPIKGLTGRATVSKDAIVFEGGSARVQGLRLDDGKVHITGLDRGSESLKVEAVVRGPLPAVLALLGHPRLDLLKGFGVNPREVRGEMAARLAIELPLLKTVTFDMVEIVAAANLRRVGVPKAALDADVSDGELTLQVDKKGMDVTGSIRLGGVPADLAWTENFVSGGRFRSRYGVKGVIDDAGRKRLGLSFGPHVTGPLAFDLVITRFDDKRTDISGTLDVKQAALVFDEIEWSKLPGTGGFARFSLNLQDGKIRHIPTLSVKAGDLDALGSFRLAADGKTIESFKFSKLVFGESDIRVSGQARPDGGLDLSVTGAMIDVRPFLEGRRKEGVKRPLSIQVDVAAARVGSGPPIYAVRGSLSRGTGDWRRMTIRGTVGKNRKPVLVRITPGGKDMRNLVITSSDAGAALRSLDITEHMVGGRLAISGKYDDTKPGNPLTGTFRVKKFQMVGAPLMAKVLGVLSLTGILDALSGKGISFDEAIVPFTKTGDDLRLKDGRAYGGALGFTAKGWVDLEKDQLDITGTVVPAYTFNKLLGYIPLLGKLLVGEKGSGVFAATYRMHGPLANPKVSHNPMAALAPGFLRGLFNIFEKPPSSPPAEGKKSSPAPARAPPPP